MRSARVSGRSAALAASPRLPVRRIGPLARAVVQDDEIAYALELLDHMLVVVRDVDRIEGSVGEVIQQSVHAAADQMNDRGLERLDEARAEAEGDAVAVPELAAPAGHEADDA